MRVIHRILYSSSDDSFCFCCHLFELWNLSRGVCVRSCLHGKCSYLFVLYSGDGQWLHEFDLLHQSWCLWAMQLLGFTNSHKGCCRLLQRENRFPSVGWLAGNMITSKSWLKGHQTYTTRKLLIAFVWRSRFSNTLLYTNTSVERGSGFRIPFFSFQEAFGRPRSIQKLEAKSPTAFMHRRFSFTTHIIYINTH